MRTMTDEERAEAIARVQFIMPGLTDEGLERLRVDAEHHAKAHGRDLSPGSLAAEQAARHGLLADADAVLMRAKRERVHGPDLHDSATDAAAVLGTTGHATEGDYLDALKADAARQAIMSEPAEPRWTDAARPPMMRERGSYEISSPGTYEMTPSGIVLHPHTVKP